MTHLRQRMIEDMGIRNLADNTQSAYLQQVISYAEHFHRSPEELGPEAVRAYQLYLMNIRRLSPSSISVAPAHCAFCTKSHSNATGPSMRFQCPSGPSSFR